MQKFVYVLDSACEDDPRRFVYQKATNREPAEGTRIYREDGDWVSFRLWFMDMRHYFGGDLIPFEWVAQYVGVTRAAVHKKVKAGQLTIFVYGMQERVQGVLGGTRERMRAEFKYAVLTECHFWRYKLLDEWYEEEEAKREKERQKEMRRRKK